MDFYDTTDERDVQQPSRLEKHLADLLGDDNRESGLAAVKVDVVYTDLVFPKPTDR